MTVLHKAPGRSSELDYLLDLAARRTPGRVQAKAASLQLGSYCVEGFVSEVDAHYLAKAANVLPNLVHQLITARAVVAEQVAELASLREEVMGLSQLLALAYEERNAARMALKDVRSGQRALRKQVKAQTPTRVEKVVRVVEVPARWCAPDGHSYELVILGDPPSPLPEGDRPSSAAKRIDRKDTASL